MSLPPIRGDGEISYAKPPPSPKVAGSPPLKLTRKEELRKAGKKLGISLGYAIPRALVGAGYMASFAVKSVVAAFAAGSAKSGIYRGKTAEVSEFGAASWREARKDLSRSLLLAFSSLLGPVGHLLTLWDVHESNERTKWTSNSIGSLNRYHFLMIGRPQSDLMLSLSVIPGFPPGANIGHFIQGDLQTLDPYFDKGEKEPPKQPHIWKKLDAVADKLSGFGRIKHAMDKARDAMPLQ